MMDAAEASLLADTLRKTMESTPSGVALDAALADVGWAELLAEEPGAAVPLVFRLLGETGAHAPLLLDVTGDGPLPFAGGTWVEWARDDAGGSTVDPDLPIRLLDRAGPAGAAGGARLAPAGLAAGRVALGWWLVGSSRAMLDLARRHALDRVQFGKPIAAFQAVRHKLAETFVAVEGAEAVLAVAPAGDELAAVVAKAAAGQAARLAGKHCQQVLGGIGFTAEHAFHRHLRRTLVLDALLGSTPELTRAAGATLRAAATAPRLVDL